MSKNPTRRRFLQRAAMASGLAGVTGLSEFPPLVGAQAAETKVAPDLVQFGPDIDPIVRLIEVTPQEKCFEVMVQRLRDGLPHRQFMAALFLAGIRNIHSDPPGGGIHAVLAIHSAYELGESAQPAERLLPMFFALDSFKSTQRRQRDSLRSAPNANLPSAEKALGEFHAGMDGWDPDRAERALVALVRSRKPPQVLDLLYRYGARDHRDIGHKAILLSNCTRALQTIGWQHAEPVFRSVIWGLLAFGEATPMEGYSMANQSYGPNWARAQKATGNLPRGWERDARDEGLTRELVSLLHKGEIDDACELSVTELGKGGVQAGAVWDAVELSACEQILRQPMHLPLFGLHALTSANALHHAFRAGQDAQSRLLVLLQGLGWMCQSRNFLANLPETDFTVVRRWNRTRFTDRKITDLGAAQIPATPEAATEDILATVATNRRLAADKAFVFARTFADSDLLIESLRRLVLVKAGPGDVHDLKFPAALFEEMRLIEPRWRPHLIAAAVFQMKGRDAPDSTTMQKAREAVKLL